MSEVALQGDNRERERETEGGRGGRKGFALRVFCKCQEQRVDGFINPLSLQNTWRRRGEGERVEISQRGVGGGGGSAEGAREEPEGEGEERG